LWQNVRDAPLPVLRELATKAWLLLCTREIPRTFDMYTYHNWSWLLRGLAFRWGPVGFPMALLLPLAVIGLIVQWKRIPAVMKLFLLCYGFSVVLVFSAARYRAPMLPILIVVAIGGAQWLAQAWRGRRYRALGVAGLAGGLLVAVASPPWRLIPERTNYLVETYLFLANDGTGSTDEQPAEQKLTWLERARELEPDNPEVQFQLAAVLLSMNRVDEAVVAARKALRRDQHHAGAHYTLAMALARQGLAAESQENLRAAVAIRPERTDWSAVLAQWLLRTDRPQEAVAVLIQFAEYECLSRSSLEQAARWVMSSPAGSRELHVAILLEFAEAISTLGNDRSVPALGLLTSAYARAGRFEDALEAAHRAQQLAESLGDRAAVEALRRQSAQLAARVNRAGSP
jgi:tetratricopeptide (TPR) repeat protein